MPLKRIDPFTFSRDIFSLWNNRWLLLTAGDFSEERYNTMTVSWGGFGIMWNKPIAEVVVRPTRHTFDFITRYPTFTLCAFPEMFRDALSLLGSRSGRDGDKIAASGLTPVAASVVGAPVFEEADFIVECRILYHHDIEPSRFSDPALDANYPKRDYHRWIVGEIVAMSEG
ncbi:MAG: flavin reductase [Bacteroidia bacterium]|nr:flavin reductase [Bacteroidia bacterium]